MIFDIYLIRLMYRALLIFSIIFSVFQSAYSLPAKRTPVEGYMQDGSQVKAVQYGDENFHYYVSLSDGSTLVRDGEIFVKAHNLRRAKNARYVNGKVPGTTFPAKGKQKVAVVLVEYQDVKFNLEDPLDYFTRMLNEEGFSDYRATGSARDWFVDSSFGQFEPEFVVMGPVTLQKNREYYGGNDAWGQDNAPQKMVIEACRQLNAMVDFSEFDRDNDGYIDNVFVVYAGRGEASGGSSDCVWPHAWTLSSAEPGAVYTFDGVRLNRYACTNEWELSDLGYGYRPVGIGSFVHEFAHVMGLPDLYTTDYSGGTFTPGGWSAMDYGPYNNDMCTPPQFSAWERSALGYMEPEALPTEAANAALEALEEGKAYIVPTDSPDEYYILENRQQTGWDTYIPGHGLLVWHIDYDEEVWRTNSVNNDANHNRVDLVEADGILDETSRHGDSFPGSAGVTSLSLKAWSGKETGHSLSDISEIGKRLAFRVNGGAADIATPRLEEETDIRAASFTVNWQPLDGATGYMVNVTGPDYEATLRAGKESNSLKVDGLEPATEYTYTLSADDGYFGSRPTELRTVMTAEPTLDYFIPVATEATETGATYFTANWQPLEGASEYQINLYRQKAGEEITVTEDFSGDINNLASGFTSTSKVTYGMASYSGAAVPALRMASDGDCLTVGDGENYIGNLTFWHRGNGTSASENLIIEADDNGEWTQIAVLPIETAQGGKTVTIEFEPYTRQTVRIRFDRKTKGAVAIDDVTATFINPEDELTDSRTVSGTSTSCVFDNLLPLTTYRYGVVATDGEYTTPESARITVTTDKTTGSIAPGAEEGPYRIIDLWGRTVKTGRGAAELPDTPGIYLIQREGKQTKKIIVRN